MDREKRKKDLSRIRSKKRRVIAKAMKELEFSRSSSSNESSSSSDTIDVTEVENTTESPSSSVKVDVVDDLELDHESDSNESLDESEEQISGNGSSETEYNFNSNPDSNDDEENDVAEEVPVLPEDIEDLDERDIQKIRKWALEHRTPLSHLDELLQILRARLLPSLPKTAKTFLRTVDARYNIEEMEDANGGFGEFVYFGVKNGLNECLNVELHEDDSFIELQFNIDPVPLTESGTQQFTPILCKVHFDPDIYEVFSVAVYHGQAKVKNAEIFLEKFVDEMNKLQRDGINIENKHFNIRLKCFICDTPVRTFLKNTLGHGGKYACERCEVEGQRVSNRMVYPSTDSRLRTNESFISQSQAQHHHPGPSPLLRILGIDIIACFVLDFMHLCCIGVMKKLLEYWLAGNLNFRLGRRSREELSAKMESLSNQVPCEFQRKPRSTRNVGKWKATEFRFFLLYAGPIVLKNTLDKNLYKHFLLLFVACRILCSKVLCHRYAMHAKKYLTSFFIALKDFYGPESQITNCHNLIHLTDDVVNMGCCLTRFTAFPFESYLGRMKKWLRTPNRPLSQLCRRYHKQKFLKKKKPTLPPTVDVLEGEDENIKRIKLKEVVISNSLPNNIVLLDDDTVVMIDKIFGNANNLQFEGRVWDKKKPLFTYPTNSTHLKIWELQRQVTPGTVTYLLNRVSCKLVKLSLKLKENQCERTFVIPLLH